MLAAVQIVRGACSIQDQPLLGTAGDEARKQRAQGRQAAFPGGALVAEQGGEDGHAAADNAGVHFGGTSKGI